MAIAYFLNSIDRISELLGYRHSHLFCANPWQYSKS